MGEDRCLSKADIKINNRVMILRTIKTEQPISRIQLAKYTNMSPTSMTRIINDLSELNLVCEVNFATNTLGRKAMLLALNKDAYYSLGITITRRWIRFTLINFTDEVLYTKSYERDMSKLSGKEIAQYMYLNYPEFISEAEEVAQLEIRGQVNCIGLSFPGIVDKTHKKVLTSPQFAMEIMTDMFRYIEYLFNLPVYIENDIKAALYNECKRYNEQNESILAYLFVDNGMGAALVIDGEVYRGATCGAGEIAYSFLGKDKAFMKALSYSCLLKRVQEMGYEVDSLAPLMELYEKKDQRIINLFDEIATSLAYEMNSILVFYNPAKLIVGGSVINELPILISLATAKKDLFYEPLFECIQIVLAKDAMYGDTIGANIVAKEEYLKQLLHDKWRQKC